MKLVQAIEDYSAPTHCFPHHLDFKRLFTRSFCKIVNGLIRCEGKLVTWGCTYSTDNPFNLSVDIVDLKYVLSRLREENERSADAVVAGKVHAIVNSV